MDWKIVLIKDTNLPYLSCHSIIKSMAALTTIFLTTSLQFGLPHGLLESVCWVESRHNPNAIHRDDGTSDSIGLCQIKLKTARYMGYRGTAKGLYNPKVNAYFAAKYLQHQIKRYKGNTIRAIIAYNQGSAKNLTRTSYSDTVFKHWETLNVQTYLSSPVRSLCRGIASTDR